jgi:hypothetical protein
MRSLEIATRKIQIDTLKRAQEESMDPATKEKTKRAVDQFLMPDWLMRLHNDIEDKEVKAAAKKVLLELLDLQLATARTLKTVMIRIETVIPDKETAEALAQALIALKISPTA